jgi:hypothetical protein
MSKHPRTGVTMWGEEASDLWGHLEWEEHDSELEILEGEREPPEGDVKPTDRETDKSIEAAGLDPG